jgi:hypothetical protein
MVASTYLHNTHLASINKFWLSATSSRARCVSLLDTCVELPIKGLVSGRSVLRELFSHPGKSISDAPIVDAFPAFT